MRHSVIVAPLESAAPGCRRGSASRSIVALAVAALAGCATAHQQTQLQRESENLRLELAQTYIAKGAKQAAIPLLRGVLAQRPNDLAVRTLYASVLRDLGLAPQAEAEYRAVLSRAPRDAAAHAGYAILCDVEGQHRRALTHHRAAVRLAPKAAMFHNNLGFSLYLAHRNAEAISELEKALALDPGLTIAYNNLGFAYGRDRQFDRAHKSFRVSGDRAAALLNMALVYEEQGDLSRADKLRAAAEVVR